MLDAQRAASRFAGVRTSGSQRKANWDPIDIQPLTINTFPLDRSRQALFFKAPAMSTGRAVKSARAVPR
jgi:hypothetical protein